MLLPDIGLNFMKHKYMYSFSNNIDFFNLEETQSVPAIIFTLRACIFVLLHHCRGTVTQYIRHPLYTRKINEEWFVVSSFFVLIRCVAQRWDTICVFFCLPSLNASDSFFIVLTSLLGSFGLQCSNDFVFHRSVLLIALQLAWTAAESVFGDLI